jgi:hypothetical protein
VVCANAGALDVSRAEPKTAAQSDAPSRYRERRDPDELIAHTVYCRRAFIGMSQIDNIRI